MTEAGDLLDVRVPMVRRTVQQEVVTRLTDFKLPEIAEFLRQHGYQVDGAYSRALIESAYKTFKQRQREDNGDDEPEGLFFDSNDLARVETLLLIGQREAARELVLDAVSDYIGRRL